MVRKYHGEKVITMKYTEDVHYREGERPWWDEPHYGLQILFTATVAGFFFAKIFGLL